MADKEDPVFRKRPASEFGPDWERIKPGDLGAGLRVEHIEDVAKNPPPSITISTPDGATEYPFHLDKLITGPDDWKASPLPEGTKKDDGKDPWDLLAWDAVREVVKVLAFGVRKYERRNWEKGIKYSRCYSAAIRHLTAWWGGEETDNETGLNHLAHAMCCVLFLLAYRVRGMDQFDDRPHKGEIK